MVKSQAKSQAKLRVRSKASPANQVSLRNVSVAFGSNRVLDDVSLAIDKGQRLLVIGPSGCGKSVMIKLILGILKPDAGEVQIKGDPRIGMLFQYSALFDSLSVWENVAFYPHFTKGLPRKKALDLSASLLLQVGLRSDILHARPSDLSGGMQKRVALARALAVDPDILICDEPTSGLDPVTGAHINALIDKITAVKTRTAITITHDMNTVESISGQVVLLYGGKIVWSGKSSEVKSSRNPYIRQFADHKLTGPIKSIKSA